MAGKAFRSGREPFQEKLFLGEQFEPREHHWEELSDQSIRPKETLSGAITHTGALLPEKNWKDFRKTISRPHFNRVYVFR